MSDLKDIIPISEWFPGKNITELLIAGPCSAESEEQVMETGKEIIKHTDIKIYRAGIWKPRTRPGSFEGVGLEGLKWLQKLKKETGLLTAVEVAYPEHIKACIEHDVDILWIGARTTANPFSVEELANALVGVDKPILVKNPVNPDLSLWIGAIERLYKKGIRKIAGVHRGFYPFEKTIFRNIPKWEIVIELKRKFPHLPIITDPSHISGTVKYLREISQKAMDLNMNGLMIETHINPKAAKSDKEQQITPVELKELLNSLKVRQAVCENEEVQNKLDQYREQIDSIDNQLLDLLAQRMDVVSEIGKHKCENNVSILQLRRWEKIIETRTEVGEKLGLGNEFIVKLLQLVHKESIQKQAEVMDKMGKCK